MSRLYNAIRKLGDKGDRAAIAICAGGGSNGNYYVEWRGAVWPVPCVTDAQAIAGDQVAILIEGKSQRPICMLGPL